MNFIFTRKESSTFVINIRKLYYYFRRLMRSGQESTQHIALQEEGSNNTNSNRSDHKQSKAKKFFLFYFYFIPRGSTSAKQKTDKVKLKIVFNNFDINYILSGKIVIQLNQIKLKKIQQKGEVYTVFFSVCVGV